MRTMNSTVQCTPTDLPLGRKSHHHPHPSSCLPSPSSQYGRNSTFNPLPRKLTHQTSCVSICPTTDANRRQKYALVKVNHPSFSQSVPHISLSGASCPLLGPSTVTAAAASTAALASSSSSSSYSSASHNCSYCANCCKVKGLSEEHVYPSACEAAAGGAVSSSAGLHYASTGVISNLKRHQQQQKYMINVQAAAAQSPSLRAILLAPTTSKFKGSTNANYTGFNVGGSHNNNNGGHTAASTSSAWPTLPRSNSTSGTHGYCQRSSFNPRQLQLHTHLVTNNQTHYQVSNSCPSQSSAHNTSPATPTSSSFKLSQVPSPQHRAQPQCHYYYDHPSSSFDSHECQERSTSQCYSKFHSFNLHHQHQQQQQQQQVNSVNGQSLQWHNKHQQQQQSHPQFQPFSSSINRQAVHKNAVTSPSSKANGDFSLPSLSTFSGKDKSSPSKKTNSCLVKRSSVTFDPTSHSHPFTTMDNYVDTAGGESNTTSATATIVCVDYDGTSNTSASSSGIDSASNLSVDHLASCNKSKVRSSISSGDSSNSSSLAHVSERGSDSECSSEGPGKLDQDLIFGPLDELDVSQYLIYNTSYENGYEIKGGKVDALIVKATEVSGNDFLFQEAFLTTYRTFISPKILIEKLLYRFNKFIMMKPANDGPYSYTGVRERLSGYSFSSSSSNHYGSSDSLYHPSHHQKAARAASSLIARVVNDLCVTECTDLLIESVEAFIHHLDQLRDEMARVLRSIIAQKKKARQAHLDPTKVLLPSVAITTKVKKLFDFKSEELAEQITFLDCELFSKIEIAEALVSAKNPKNTTNIPNLAKFTEHFNNKSYWIRSRILQEEDASERKRIVIKFIKIMRALKKLKNFNSIFAILSALDSAPIKRLDWPKSVLEELKEFEQLSDSSSSFQFYRNALADAEPPCIPYVGLILQDLTFVHVGNEDYLDNEGNVNFTKCWLQFDILVQMRRFRNCHYRFNRNEEIIGFFANFEDYLHEESLWQISESIKPRGKKTSQS